MRRALLALLVLIPTPSLQAALDPETAKPYKLRLVVSCGAHNWLSDTFRRDVGAGVASAVKDALGPLAEVEAIDLKTVPADKREPLWSEFETKGFAALDSAKDLTEAKTHFLRVDYLNGAYDIQARQYDGYTGFAGPARRERTTDRALVSRLAGQMVARDFGLVGTVTGTGRQVTVQLKGGGLAGVGDWVKRGDVLALVAIVPPPRNSTSKLPRGVRAQNAVLQVLDDPKNGAVTGRLEYRGLSSPLTSTPLALGFRAIRLGTVRTPLRLRLVDEKGQPHARTLQLRVHPERFPEGESADEEVINPERGLFTSKRAYDGVAFVRVVTGGTVVAKIPVELLDAKALTLEVGIDATQERQGQLQVAKRDLMRSITEGIVVQADRRDAVNRLIEQRKVKEALDAAKASRRTLEEDIPRLNQEIARLKQEIGSLGIKMDDCESRLTQLEDYQATITRRVAQLEDLWQVENDPSNVAAKKKLQQLKAKFEGQRDALDIEGAIATLKALLKEVPDDASTKSLLSTLEAEWAIKSPAHKTARDFVYKEWAGSKTSAEMEGRLPVAREKVAVLRGVKDLFALRKLQQSVSELHQKIVAPELDSLEGDDAARKERLSKLVEGLLALDKDVTAALQAK